MSVVIKSVDAGSPAACAGINGGDTLVSINGEEIVDVLDYRFYQRDKRLKLSVLDRNGHHRVFRVKKAEEDELGLRFETYLIDKQHSCKNKCIFCFIDQLPQGLRDTLYFKDDDSRLSFLFGNYITLTNLTEHEISRIIKMHISPVNISVHTTNPGLRVKMMRNKNAGETLSIIKRFNDSSIAINCQLVLCPGYNDGTELRRTLEDLTAMEHIGCIAAVPVGLTRFRDGLTPLEPFNSETAGAVLDIIEEYGQRCLKRYGSRRVYGADEFYLMSGRPVPPSEFYEDFLQLENGVGLWALLRDEMREATADAPAEIAPRKVSIATGVSAAKLLCETVDLLSKKCHNLNCKVYPVKNEFFGENITVAGLVTGGDILNQLKDKELGDALLIPSVMLRHEGDLFLDSMHINTLSEKLGVPVIPVGNNGYELVNAILGVD